MISRFFLCRLVLCIALAVPLASAETIVAIDQAYLNVAPYIIDDLKAAYNAIGEPVRFEIVPGARALIAANSGYYGALDARIKGTDQVSNMVAVEVPIYTSVNLVAWSALPMVTINSISDLARYSVVIPRDNAIALTLTKRHGIPVTIVDSIEQAMRMVSAKRVDILLSTDLLVELQQKAGRGTTLKVVSESLQTMWVYHHIHKSRAYLVPALEKSIRELKAEGLFVLR